MKAFTLKIWDSISTFYESSNTFSLIATISASALTEITLLLKV